jgi:hypothetical protein
MDSSTAAFYGLPTVQIKRADGSLISATPAAITQAIADATTQADGTLALNYADPNPNAYPMPMPTYLVAPTNTIDISRGAVLAGFLRYAVQDGQASLPAGYAPLPAALVSESLQVAGAIPASPPPTPHPTPTPGPSATPPSTSPSTSTGGSSGSSLGSSLYSGAQVPAVAHLTQQLLTTKPATTASKPAAHGATKSGGGAKKSPSVGGRRPAFELAQIGDWSGFRIVVPTVVALGVLGVGAGITMEVLVRRRRAALTEGPS